MTVSEAIKGRRSIRNYADKPVEEEKLRAVLGAARLAPSACNSQRWKFIAVRDVSKRRAMVEACGGQQFVGEAPVVLAVCADDRGEMTCGQPAATVDASIAMTHMLLEAYEQGLGTCWLGNFHEGKVKAILNVPENVRVVAVSPLGYPAESPHPRPRKNFDEVVSYDAY